MAKKVSGTPKRFFGLHFSPGVVEYPSLEKRVFISPELAKQMDPSFEGKPLFVNHVDDYDVSTLPEISDGYVIRSFYNVYDGNNWVEFLAVSDDAIEKIAQGWKLSNSLKVEVDNIPGTSKNVSYDTAATSGYYHHLALVQVPRYENSEIKTPEEFKAYNEKLKAQLEQLNNSKEEEKMSVLKFFEKKASTVDTLKDMSVILPKSNIEKTVMQLINEADEAEMKKDEKKYANESDIVKIGDEEVSVKDLVAKIMEFMAEMDKANKVDVKEEVDSLDNADEGKDEKKEEKKDEKLDNSKTQSKFASLKLRNESDKGIQVSEPVNVQRSSMKAQIELGNSKY